MQMVVVSNATKAGFFNVDFSPAVVTSGDGGSDIEKTSANSARPTCMVTCMFTNGLSTRNTINVMGKDAAGNYWLGGALRRGLWRRIEDALSADSGK